MKSPFMTFILVGQIPFYPQCYDLSLCCGLSAVPDLLSLFLCAHSAGNWRIASCEFKPPHQKVCW